MAIINGKTYEIYAIFEIAPVNGIPRLKGLVIFTFGKSNLLSREMVLSIVELCGPNVRLCIL